MRIVHLGITEIYYYVYDHVGRKTKFLHSLNGKLKVIAKYDYDKIGRLKTKQFSPSDAIGSNQSGLWTQTGTWQGGSLPTISDQVTINTGHTVTIPNGQTVQAGTLFNQGILQNFGVLQMGTLAGNNVGTLQTIDYNYHIRGGLRGINLDASGNLTNKLFSMRLDYENDGNYFDGNIRKQEWKSSIDNLTRSYTYSYDGASRILSGVYGGGKPNENYALNSVSYDGNGNVVSLSRNGFKANNTFGLVDNLAYTYNTNSNKILKVDDISNETASFTDVSGNDYTYSADGSLTSDANKGITLIEYNYLKLPKRIVKGSTTILYQYDASGKKLKETIGTNVTDYVGNLIYKNGVLYQSGHDEGRIINGEYEYNIKDHLGNLRVAFRDSSGIVKVVQANSYGVWGEDLPTLSYLKSSWKVDNFRVSGKEFESETGLNDFGWRRQDPILGRMWSVDFLAERFVETTPFHYALNNPIVNIEVDGDTTQFYDINNNSLISTINDTSPMNRVKINRHIYDNVSAQYNDVDLDDQNNAFAFVGDVTYLAEEIEEATDLNVLAKETGILSLDFGGVANVNNLQEANGTLNIISAFDDGSTLNIGRFNAIGGYFGNGSPENGEYTASGLRVRNKKGMVRDGVGFSMNLDPSFSTGRDLLRIHPDGGVRGTQGCIGLQCDATQLNLFYNTMHKYLEHHTNIGVSVNIQNNPNNNGRSTRRRRNNGE